MSESLEYSFCGQMESRFWGVKPSASVPSQSGSAKQRLLLLLVDMEAEELVEVAPCWDCSSHINTLSTLGQNTSEHGTPFSSLTQLLDFSILGTWKAA